MADKKISALTASATPLTGAEVLPIVQSGSTVKVSVANLTAGRAVSASSLTASTDNVIIETTAKGITTGSAIPLGFGVNNTVTAMTIDTSSNLAVGTSAVISSARVTINKDTNVRFNLASDTVERFGVYADASLAAVYAGVGIPMTFTTGTLERMRISAAGDITAVTGNLVVGTAGKGIDFSANTHAAGMTSELLNDYEEGTWTPVIVGSSTAGTGTYSTQVGRYTKIGRTVHFTAYVVWSAHTGTGNMSISGLPFSSEATANVFFQFSPFSSNLAYTANSQLQLLMFNNSTSLGFYQVNGGAAASQVAVDTAADVLVTGTYSI